MPINDSGGPSDQESLGSTKLLIAPFRGLLMLRWNAAGTGDLPAQYIQCIIKRPDRGIVKNIACGSGGPSDQESWALQSCLSRRSEDY